MTRVGIIGATGYTGGELLRLLLHHPAAHVQWIHSASHAGERITMVHPDLVGDTELLCTDTPTPDVDCVFLCVDHGVASKMIHSYPWLLNLKLIDLSNEYRHASAEHDFVYGLPEAFRESIISAHHIANPGCFATSIQLGLLPLARHAMLRDDIHVCATTGSTGAGRKHEPTVHFSWRSNNLQVYKPFEHQHVPEIVRTVNALQPGFEHEVLFVPHRGNFTRGILASMYTSVDISQDDAEDLFRNFYAPHPFVEIVSSSPDMKRVVNTNKAHVWVSVHRGKLLAVCVLDNLLKGASGQAVQNMNLIFGFEETLGMQLKASAF